MKRAKPDAGTLLAIHLRELKQDFVREYKFCDTRNWRADFCVRNGDGVNWFGTLIEIEGAVWANGRHTRGSGYVKDLEKYTMASAIGYKLFRFSTEQVETGKAKEFLKEWL